MRPAPVIRAMMGGLIGAVFGAILTGASAIGISSGEGYAIPKTPGPWLDAFAVSLFSWFIGMLLVGFPAAVYFDWRGWRGRGQAAGGGFIIAGLLGLIGSQLTNGFGVAWAESLYFSLALAFSGAAAGYVVSLILLPPSVRLHGDEESVFD